MSFFKHGMKFPHSRIFTDSIGSKKKGNGLANSIFTHLSNVFNCGKAPSLSILLIFDCENGLCGIAEFDSFPISQKIITSIYSNGVKVMDFGESLFMFQGSSFSFRLNDTVPLLCGTNVYLKYHIHLNTYQSNTVFIAECPSINPTIPVGVCDAGTLTISTTVSYAGFSTVENRKYVLEYFDGVSWIEGDSVLNMGYSGDIELSFVENSLSGQSFPTRVRVLDLSDVELISSIEMTCDAPVC